MKGLLILFLLLLSAEAKETQTAPKNSTVTVSKQELSDARGIEVLYQNFIDTRPSAKKKQLATATKNAIETFEAKYPTSPLLKATLELLVEVDNYLDN